MRAPAIAFVLLLVLAWVPAAHAANLFVEDWESGSGAWTIDGSGAQIQCDTSCAMHVEPPCCGDGQRLVVSHALDAPLSSDVSVRFDFRPGSLSGDTDTELRFVLDTNEQVLLALTGGVNNAIFVETSTGHADAPFAYTTSPSTWVHLSLTIQSATRTVVGALLDENGNVLASSNPVSIDAGSTRVASILIDAVSWTQNRVGFDYDNLRVEGASSCVPSANLAGPASVRAGANATFATSVTACGPASWTLDFGDGASLAGAGVPPANLTHAYKSGGNYTATLSIAQDDGPGLVATARVHVIAPVTQRVEGTIHAITPFTSNPASRMIPLDATSDGTFRARLDYAALADLDLAFYDATGAPLPSGCSSAGVDASESCFVPARAAYAQVRGVGVAADWTMFYTWFPTA